MYINLFQRPANSPEYDFQRREGHRLRLKATIFIETNQFSDTALMDICRNDHEIYGDELAIWLAPTESMPNTMVWLLSEAEKEECVKISVERFRNTFGYLPTACGNYLLDSSLIRLLRKYCPGIRGVVAGCFEEGVRVYHGCNNSWYLFSEGMSWGPWYPSVDHSLRPAENTEDWAGVVAVPHLSRDLVLSYENRDDFFASHPANIQRGLVNEGPIHPYDFNLCDQQRMQAYYNDGFAYYQIHVGSTWLSHHHNIIDPDEVTQGMYSETLNYLSQLCKSGDAQSVTLTEFADAYQSTFPIGKPTVGIGKDILTGSGKHYYWLFSPAYRVLIDTFQGGSIGDLRPYIGHYSAITGTDAPDGRYHMGSYPYLIHSQYRTGSKHHYEDGARTTLFLQHGDERVDLCSCSAKIASVASRDHHQSLLLTPICVTFSDGAQATIQTEYSFEDNGDIVITRKLLHVSEHCNDLVLCEYVKGCYGFTEYPEDMKGITFLADGKTIDTYQYSAKSHTFFGNHHIEAAIPQIHTSISLLPISLAESMKISDGHLFSPFYTMECTYRYQNNRKEIRTCLMLRKMKA